MRGWVRLGATKTEPYSMIHSPTTLLEFLSNLKLAFDSDLPLREDFYSDERLKAFSGGRKVRWLRTTETQRWAEVIDFGKMIDTMKVGDATYSGISFRNERTVSADGKIHASADLLLRERNQSVAFENVERIFGRNWEVYPYFPPPQGRVFQPATAPHGNDRIAYSTAGPAVQRSIVLYQAP
jgi:hypothetical protein